jgi:arginyl-tRNA--protein-N-Asp/Glu arginylyltransferase
MAYLNWDTKKITDFSPENVAGMYDAGYVFTRVDKGIMNRTRSFRVDLKAYAPSSENKRILRKVETLTMTIEPIPYPSYSWEIGKLAKDFYEKFGDNVFTANKTKEILTDAEKSNFNRLLVFKDEKGAAVGYSICYESDKILHYSYPFYVEEPSRGIGMMTKALEWAKAADKDYIYLGSLQRPGDTYKLQFLGGEWFDGEHWQADTSPLRELLKYKADKTP